MSPSCRANGVVQRRFRPSHTSSQAQVPCGKEPHRHGQWGRHRESRPRRRGVVRPRGHLCRLGKRPCSRRHPRSTTESMGDYKCWPSPAAPHCLLHDELADERMGSRPACFPWAPDSRRSTYKGTECTALEWTAGPSWPCCCCYQCHPVVSRNHPQSPCICCYSTPELLCDILCRLPAPTRRRDSVFGGRLVTATVNWAGI